MSKNISVRVSGADGTSEIKEITLKPGTTAGDIKKAAKLEEYNLSKGKGKAFIADNEDVYTQVEEGDKLYASLISDVGTEGSCN